MARSGRCRYIVPALAIIAGVVLMGWSIAAAAGESGAGQGSAGEPDERPRDAGKQVIVYYFHGKVRCNTCRTIEAYAKEAIESRFGGHIKSGLLAWKVIDFDEPENEHFIEELGLVSSSLVVAVRKGDRPAGHEILQEVWTLVRDKPRFTSYVQKAVEGLLE